MAGVVNVFAAMRLGDERIQSKQEAAAENRYAVVKALSEAGRADGDRAIGQASDHDRVDDAHAHPADLGDDEGQSQAQSQDEVCAQRVMRSGLRFDRHGLLVNISTGRRDECSSFVSDQANSFRAVSQIASTAGCFGFAPRR